MLDLETYATTMDACVMTIGAVVFDLSGKQLESFYRRIDSASCDAIGLRKDPKTIAFWSQQSDKSRHEIETLENRVNIQDAIHDFTQFWKANRCDFLWCNGANFDEPILSTIYDKLGMEKPWRFFNVRCVRTLLSLVNLKTSSTGLVSHHAVDDCRNQIKGVNKAFKMLNLI
jgi:hypothetical protein